MKLPDAPDLAEFIAGRYTGAEKIVELMVGSHPWVAVELRRLLPKTKLIVTDVDEEKLRSIKNCCVGIDAFRDDLRTPDYRKYKGASLLYCVRPPPDIVPKIVELATIVQSDLLIRPFHGEPDAYEYRKSEGWELIRHGRARFHLLTGPGMAKATLHQFGMRDPIADSRNGR